MDIEADDLLADVTTAWIIGFMDADTGEIKYWLDGDLGWIEEFDKIDVFIGHNEASYDFPVLEKLFKWKPKKGVKIQDTLILSQTLNYKRFNNDGHSLERWGEYLNAPKGDFKDFKHAEGETKEQFWERVGERMLTYWKQDLHVTGKVHTHVWREYMAIREKTPAITQYLKAEVASAFWCARASLYGWPFDKAAAVPLFEKMEIELNKVREKLMPRLGKKVVAVDKKNGIVEHKTPKWVKSGAYALATANWFGINEFSGQDEDRLIEGPYSRIEVRDLDIDSINDVKIFLFRNGWVPTEYNVKHVLNEETGRIEKQKTSPKITEDSLECMEGDGKLYCDFLTTKSRHSILKSWLHNLDANNRLHGDCMVVGTPSMRARHSIIVNVPAAESVWGPEMRSLFTVEPGLKLIGADSAGNQARGLAHYLKSDEFTYQLINGDIHTFNANALDSVLKDMGISWDNYLITKKGIQADEEHTLQENLAKRKRASAKRILYAFLFGASGGKLWSYIFDTIDDSKGKKLKSGFTKAVPGFKALLDRLETIFARTKQTGNGYIPGIAGNRIYCDSFHKLLVYLLQACEKATCAAALMLAVDRLEEANIWYQPCIFMHDEIDFLVKEEDAEAAAIIAKEAFRDGPKLFGIEIMDGEAKIGNNWLEVH
jgi:hypothetical protein